MFESNQTMLPLLSEDIDMKLVFDNINVLLKNEDIKNEEFVMEHVKQIKDYFTEKALTTVYKAIGIASNCGISQAPCSTPQREADDEVQNSCEQSDHTQFAPTLFESANDGNLSQRASDEIILHLDTSSIGNDTTKALANSNEKITSTNDSIQANCESFLRRSGRKTTPVQKIYDPFKMTLSVKKRKFSYSRKYKCCACRRKQASPDV